MTVTAALCEPELSRIRSKLLRRNRLRVGPRFSASAETSSCLLSRCHGARWIYGCKSVCVHIPLPPPCHTWHTPTGSESLCFSCQQAALNKQNLCLSVSTRLKSLLITSDSDRTLTQQRWFLVFPVRFLQSDKRCAVLFVLVLKCSINSGKKIVGAVTFSTSYFKKKYLTLITNANKNARRSIQLHQKHDSLWNQFLLLPLFDLLAVSSPSATFN